MTDRYYYLDNHKGDDAKDLLQKGDEFQEPLHYQTKGAGVEWHRILESRVGHRPCVGPTYRRKIK